MNPQKIYLLGNTSFVSVCGIYPLPSRVIWEAVFHPEMTEMFSYVVDAVADTRCDCNTTTLCQQGCREPNTEIWLRNSSFYGPLFWRFLEKT